MSHKCVSCRQPSAPQHNTMMHTTSHTFWSLQLMCVVTAVWVFSVRSPMVRRQTLHTAALDDSRGKFIAAWGPGIVVVIWLILCAQSIAWEELHSTSLAHRQRNDVVPNPTKELVEPTSCSVHYSSDRSLNNCRCLSTSTPPLTKSGPKTVFLCIKHNTFVLVLVWWWASTATQALSCPQHTRSAGLCIHLSSNKPRR